MSSTPLRAHPPNAPTPASPHQPSIIDVYVADAASASPTPSLQESTSESHHYPQSSIAISTSVSRATTTVTTTTTCGIPPPPPVEDRPLRLRPSSSLHSLLSTYRTPQVPEARAPTASEAAAEFASRGSCTMREGEADVELLLLDTTRAFSTSITKSEMTTTTTPVDATASPLTAGPATSVKDADATVSVVSPLPFDRSGSSPATTSPDTSVAPPRTTQPPAVGSTEETVETHNSQKRRVVVHDLPSESSLRSPPTASPPRQRLTSTVLYPVTPLDNRGLARPPPPPRSSSGGTPDATSLSAKTTFTYDDLDEPRPFMHFPVFHRLPDSVLSRSSRSNRGASGGRSGVRRRHTPRREMDTAGGAAALNTSAAPDGFQRLGEEARVEDSSMACGSPRTDSRAAASPVVDPPPRLEVDGSAPLPCAAPYASMYGSGTFLSSEEFAAPSRSPSRTPAELRTSASRRHSRTARQHSTASHLHEIISDMSFPSTMVNSAPRVLSVPSVQLGPPMPPHLYRVSQDGNTSAEPLPMTDTYTGQVVTPFLGPANPHDSISANMPLTHSTEVGRHRRSATASLLPPISAPTSLSNVHEMSSQLSNRASSVVNTRDSPVSCGAGTPFTPTVAVMHRTPLLGRLFREPKRSKGRVWVAAGDAASSRSAHPSPPPAQDTQKQS